MLNVISFFTSVLAKLEVYQEKAEVGGQYVWPSI